MITTSLLNSWIANGRKVRVVLGDGKERTPEVFMGFPDREPVRVKAIGCAANMLDEVFLQFEYSPLRPGHIVLVDGAAYHLVT